MANPITSAIDALVVEANSDAALRARLLTDPRGTIAAETGMTAPDNWSIIARENNGMVELAFENDELPDDYLELVAGGISGPGGSFLSNC